MLHDTRSILRDFRKSHYLTRKGADDTDQTCWYITHPQGNYNTTTHTYERNDANAFVVECYNPAPINIGPITLCFGRPTVYLPEVLEKTTVGSEVTKIVKRHRRAKLVIKTI